MRLQYRRLDRRPPTHDIRAWSRLRQRPTKYRRKINDILTMREGSVTPQLSVMRNSAGCYLIRQYCKLTLSFSANFAGVVTLPGKLPITHCLSQSRAQICKKKTHVAITFFNFFLYLLIEFRWSLGWNGCSSCFYFFQYIFFMVMHWRTIWIRSSALNAKFRACKFGMV